MCVCSCYAEQVAGSIWPPSLHHSEYSNSLAAAVQLIRAYTHTQPPPPPKKSEQNIPDPGDMPTAAGEEKSANPLIKSV